MTRRKYKKIIKGYARNDEERDLMLLFVRDGTYGRIVHYSYKEFSRLVRYR